MDIQQSVWDNFTNKYSLSKTIRFELKPIGKTFDYIKKNGLIEEDKKRDVDFKKVKLIMNEYYKEYIDYALNNITIDLNDLKEYQEIYENYKNDYYNNLLKKEYNKIQKKIRESIYKKLEKLENFKDIFGKNFINTILPKWLNEKNRFEDQKLVESFGKWVTYFNGFFENRKNIFSKNDIPTSIIYRIVTDNLPKFLNNLDKFEKLKKISDFEYKSIENELSNELDNKKLNDIFKLENYNNFLNQGGIDLFNLIIGGKTENNNKIKGLNELINLYSQKLEKDESKKIRKLKMNILFKQILSDKESFSEKLTVLKNNDDVINTINEYYKNIYLKNIPKLKKLFNNFDKYDLKQIYFKNDRSLTDISKQIFGDWNFVQESLIYYTSEIIKLNKTNKKLFLNKKYYSLYNLEEAIKIKNDNSELKRESIINYLNKFCNKKLDGENKLLEQIEKNNELFKKIEYNKLNKFSEETINIIKQFLDSINDIFHFIKPLYVKQNNNQKEIYELDSDFYNEFILIYDEFSKIIPIYNKVRNYITKKPYSIKKFKLNFNNSTLLDGWDKNKEKDNLSILFKKENKYFLGIINKNIKDKNLFDNIEEYIGNNYYEKMVYKLLPGPNKDLPKAFFSKKGLKIYNPPEEIRNIINYATHTKNGKPKPGFEKKEFNLKDSHKLIDFYKISLQKHPVWKKHFKFKFKDTDKYKDISEFYKDISDQAYKINFIKISEKYIDQLVNEGKLYLFNVYNKDFSKFSHGKPNLHTIYWNELFSEDNLKNIIFKLNGKGEIFFREKSIERKITHPKNNPINNKLPINKKQSVFSYDLIKDKRYTEDKFLFHCPITINNRSKGSEKTIHKEVNEFIKNTDKEIKVIGIDRGERNLLYYNLLDSKGNILKQKSLNIISDDVNRKMDYHKILDEKETNRSKARINWTTIEGIKDLKSGYLSKVIHEISKLAIENNAIIVLENLNYGFKKGRFKIEKQVYQKFEKMLIDKLNYLIFKDKKNMDLGGALHGYQLTNKFECFKKLGKQSGILYYVNASYTSKIDPKTGFINMIYPKYTSVKNAISFFNKFEYIKYNSNEDLFEFNFNYTNFNKDIKLDKNNWSIFSNGIKLINFRAKDKNNKWITKEINVNDELKKLFDEYSIDYLKINNLITKINLQDDKQFFERLIFNLKLILQLRNSRINSNEDYILSCTKDKNGHFFDSRNKLDGPIDSDSNGAYNIALKGLMLIDKIKNGQKLDINKQEFLNYVIRKNNMI